MPEYGSTESKKTMTTEKRDVLQAMLQCCFNMELCRRPRQTVFDMLGGLDWYQEFHRLAVEAGAIRDK
jgi:hypothetical protein